jgi:hypothetical protein
MLHNDSAVKSYVVLGIPSILSYEGKHTFQKDINNTVAGLLSSVLLDVIYG